MKTRVDIYHPVETPFVAEDEENLKKCCRDILMLNALRRVLVDGLIDNDK